MKNPFQLIRRFSSEMVVELKKAAWPTWVELKDSTIVVLVSMLLLGSYTGIIDFSLYQVVSLLSSLVAGGGA